MPKRFTLATVSTPPDCDLDHRLIIPKPPPPLRMDRLQKEFLRQRGPGLRAAKMIGEECYLTLRELLYDQWFDIWPEPDRMPGDTRPDPSFHKWRVEKTKLVGLLSLHPFPQQLKYRRGSTR